MEVTDGYFLLRVSARCDETARFHASLHALRIVEILGENLAPILVVTPMVEELGLDLRLLTRRVTLDRPYVEKAALGIIAIGTDTIANGRFGRHQRYEIREDMPVD